jgi:murein L,D-transpeptidase YcbB/YkuD
MLPYQSDAGERADRVAGWEARGARFLIACAVACASCLAAPAAHAQLPRSEVQALRADIARGIVEGAQHGDLPRYRAALLRSYPDSGASLHWIENGRLTPQGAMLLAELRRAEMRGLDPADYDGEALALAFRILDPSVGSKATGDATLRADAWLTLTAMRFIDHARRGRADPRALGFALSRQPNEPELASRVVQLSAADDLHALIDSLEPPFRRFRSLETLLRIYRTLAADSTLGRLPQIAASIRPDDHWSGVPALRRLLSAFGDLAPLPAATSGADSDFYDAPLVDAVKHFQERHALTTDGVVGRATLAQLRTPISSRVRQIELTMERWRWLPDPVASRLLVINIPEFHLYALERDSGSVRAEERMDVVVGSAYAGRHTPVFESTLRYVVFHPFWDVPRSIARREEVPKIRRNPAYAIRMGMEIVKGGDDHAVRFPITKANLQRVIDGTLRLRQRPGPLNALGEIKFVFPNSYNVYLHGTPEQQLFELPRRDFSHGCIRASDPERLAEFVLRDQRGWDRTRILSSVADTTRRTVTLDRPLPVFVVYATVIVDPDGIPSFLPDLYGHDATLARVLRLRSIAAQPDVRASREQTDRPCLTDCSLGRSNAPVEHCGG